MKLPSIIFVLVMGLELITESTSDKHGWSYKVIMNILNAAVPPASAGVALTENVVVPATTEVISIETWSPTILNGVLIKATGSASFLTKV